MFRFQFDNVCDCDHPTVEIFDQPEVTKWVYDNIGHIDKYHHLGQLSDAEFDYSYGSCRQKKFNRLPIFQKILLFNPENSIPMEILDLVENKLTHFLSSKSECRLTMTFVTTSENDIYYLQIYLSKDIDYGWWPFGKNTYDISSQFFQSQIGLDKN
jgi:hypothetical protein